MSRWPSVISTISVLAGGYLVLAAATDHWTIWTAEGARRKAVQNHPVPLPAAALQDALGQVEGFGDFDRPLMLVDFIYTRCPGACIAMGTAFRRWQRDLEQARLAGQVQLLSISFDMEHDGPAQLAGYLSRFSADTEHWNAARFEDEAQLKRFLDALGVVVIPEPEVGFVHNTAVYLVDQGAVAGIYDLEDSAGLMAAIRWRLDNR